jgi:hypothetical protein
MLMMVVFHLSAPVKIYSIYTQLKTCLSKTSGRPAHSSCFFRSPVLLEVCTAAGAWLLRQAALPRPISFHPILFRLEPTVCFYGSYLQKRGD